MKDLFRISALVAMVFGMVACSNDDENNGYLGIIITDEEDKNLVFGAGGGSETVVFTVACDWQVTPYDEWVEVSPEEGGIYNTYFIVKVPKYDGVEPRESHLLIKLANGNALKIPVTQKKANLIETPDAEAYTMPAEHSSIDIPITTNVDFDVVVPADATWLECSSSTRAMEKAKLTFTALANTSNMTRVAVVGLLDEEGKVFQRFTIVQASLYEAVNQISYHSSEYRTVDLASTKGFGASMLTHFYGDECGYIVFDDAITTIPDDAFSGCNTIESITLPEQVVTIGSRAFKGCEALAELPLRDGIRTIGDKAFEGCTAVDEVTLPASVESIGSGVFAYCKGELTTYCAIPNQSEDATATSHWLNGSTFDSVNVAGRVGASAFAAYTPLRRVTFMNEVPSVGSSAFAGCSNLCDLYIESLVDWCAVSFGDEESNPMHLGVTINIDEEPITELLIPSKVQSIGKYAFYNAASLESVTLPDSVTSIGQSAFAGCVDADFNLGSGISAVGNDAFKGCKGNNLRIGFNIPAQTANTEARNNWFQGSEFVHIWFGDKVTSIGDMAFGAYDAVESITLSDSVEYIGEAAFAQCNNLTKIVFGNGLKTIDKHAFYMCQSLEIVELPEGLTHLNGYAFNGCGSLLRIVLPRSVEYLGEYLFDYCSALTSIYCKPTTPPQLGDRYALSGMPHDCRIYVPESAVASYKSADIWSNYANIIEGYAY